MEDKTRVYGYARVSTKEQNLDRQMESLTVTGVMNHEYSQKNKKMKKTGNV